MGDALDCSGHRAFPVVRSGCDAVAFHEPSLGSGDLPGDGQNSGQCGRRSWNHSQCRRLHRGAPQDSIDALRSLGRWLGSESRKGDRVKEGQVLVRLEDSEYQAQLLQAQGNLQNLLAQLLELETGSRPEEKPVRWPTWRRQKPTSKTHASTWIARKVCSKKEVVPKQELDNASGSLRCPSGSRGFPRKRSRTRPHRPAPGTD